MDLSKRFNRAFKMASRLHAGHERKGTEVPYLGHLLGVTAIVIDDGGNEDECIAALLHDAAEDQGGEWVLHEIRRKFGKRVAGLVRDLSDTTEKPKPAWRKRKEAYLAHLEETDAAVLRISLADKLHNGRAILLDRAEIGEAIWDRFSVSKDESLWYYQSLAEIFARRKPGPLADEFRRTVDRLADT
jgi:(p)ppGpp synthase/HD superfamily hydrolase